LEARAVKEAPKEVIDAGATLALITEDNEAAEAFNRFADAGNAPPFFAASEDKLLAFEISEPVEFIAKEAKKAPYAAAAGSVVVILDVGEVRGSGAESKLTP